MYIGIIDYSHYFCLLSKRNDKKLKHEENMYSKRLVNFLKELLKTVHNPQKLYLIIFHVSTEIKIGLLFKGLICC